MISEVTINIDPHIKHLGIFLYYGIAHDVIVEKDRVDIREYAKKVINSIINSYVIERLREHPIIRAYRNTMWRLGIDPTKIRISSEALLRRVLRRGTFPHINNVVDSCNLASLETLVPISIFDLHKIKSVIILRCAKPGEVFKSLSNEDEVLRGYEVVLAEVDGKILHLYPHKDSKETLVTNETRDVLVVAYGAPEIPRLLVRDAVSKTLNYLTMFCNAKNLKGIYEVT